MRELNIHKVGVNLPFTQITIIIIIIISVVRKKLTVKRPQVKTPLIGKKCERASLQ